MNTEGALLQMILEEPDDDAPRLVYADWLEEHGDPRGEFIQVQCALAGMSENDDRRWGLEVRELRLVPMQPFQRREENCDSLHGHLREPPEGCNGRILRFQQTSGDIGGFGH